MSGNEKKNDGGMMRMVLIGVGTTIGIGIIALSMVNVIGGGATPLMQPFDEPCLDEERAGLDGLGPGEAVARLEARRDEATRRAGEHRRSARLLERDPRRDDPEQREFVDEAVATSEAMSDEYEAEATTAADQIECLEGGG